MAYILARALGATLVAGRNRFSRLFVELARTAPEHPDLTSSPSVRLTFDASYWYHEAYLGGRLLVLACVPFTLEVHLPHCTTSQQVRHRISGALAKIARALDGGDP